MPLSDNLIFCGHICMAAKRLGIGLMPQDADDYFQYAWGDPAGAVIGAAPKPTKEEALFAACERLVEYLNQE